MKSRQLPPGITFSMPREDSSHRDYELMDILSGEEVIHTVRKKWNPDRAEEVFHTDMEDEAWNWLYATGRADRRKAA